ncbi:hypothetical protein A4X09_0g7714 [Tilletia walkeri]|uniref:J domain-containing protein n=1 Tax=Tilletia walkeri TaxID=117179 RepID=A0A8X7N1E8_9BASI|nr:hypothetical protein A4X09_0g7714 [Tilletia walkeri]
MATFSRHSAAHPIVIDSDSDDEVAVRGPPASPFGLEDTKLCNALALLQVPLTLNFSSLKPHHRRFMGHIHPDRCYAAPLPSQYSADANAAYDCIEEREDFTSAIALASEEHRWYGHMLKYYERILDLAKREGASYVRARKGEARSRTEALREKEEHARKRAEVAENAQLRSTVRAAVANVAARLAPRRSPPPFEGEDPTFDHQPPSPYVPAAEGFIQPAFITPAPSHTVPNLATSHNAGPPPHHPPTAVPPLSSQPSSQHTSPLPVLCQPPIPTLGSTSSTPSLPTPSPATPTTLPSLSPTPTTHHTVSPPVAQHLPILTPAPASNPTVLPTPPPPTPSLASLTSAPSDPPPPIPTNSARTLRNQKKKQGKARAKERKQREEWVRLTHLADAAYKKWKKK